jgi:hypothetical protein
MKRTHLLYLSICLCLILMLSPALPVLAQEGDEDFQISWWTIVGGGGTSEEGDFSLTGIIGQPATDLLQEGDYNLIGGLLNNEAAANSDGGGNVYLPVIIRN